jgi:hypothetical protein
MNYTIRWRRDAEGIVWYIGLRSDGKWVEWAFGTGRAMVEVAPE